MFIVKPLFRYCLIAISLVWMGSALADITCPPTSGFPAKIKATVPETSNYTFTIAFVMNKRNQPPPPTSVNKNSPAIITVCLQPLETTYIQFTNTDSSVYNMQGGPDGPCWYAITMSEDATQLIAKQYSSLNTCGIGLTGWGTIDSTKNQFVYPASQITLVISS